MKIKLVKKLEPGTYSPEIDSDAVSLYNTVIDFYSECYADHCLVWGLRRNLGLHYGFYDERHKRHSPAVMNMNRVLAEIAKITRKDNVLDAGCGIGGTALWIAKHTGARVTGLNIHPGQLAIAKGIAERKDEDEDGLVDFIEGDFTATPFPSGVFDVVLALESACYTEDKRSFLEEAKRVLKKGSRLVIADGFSREGLEEGEKTEMGKWLKGWAIPNLSSVREFRGYLEELGFSNVQFRDITKNVMSSSLRMYRIGSLFCPIGRALEVLKLRTKVQNSSTRSAIYQHKTLKNGLWTYGVFSASA